MPWCPPGVVRPPGRWVWVGLGEAIGSEDAEVVDRGDEERDSQLPDRGAVDHHVPPCAKLVPRCVVVPASVNEANPPGKKFPEKQLSVPPSTAMVGG